MTLWDEYGEKIRDIRYFTESDFWDIYYNKLLKKEEKKKKKKQKKELFWIYII